MKFLRWFACGCGFALLPAALPAAAASGVAPGPATPATAPVAVVPSPATQPEAKGGFGAFIKELFTPKTVDTMPEVRVAVHPQYPFEMLRAHQPGYVNVEFIVDPNGAVVDARVVKSSHPSFEEPALIAIRKWKFKPGRKGPRAVYVRVAQRIEFALDK